MKQNLPKLRPNEWFTTDWKWWMFVSRPGDGFHIKFGRSSLTDAISTFEMSLLHINRNNGFQDFKEKPFVFWRPGQRQDIFRKIQSFVSQLNAPRHVGHPKGFTVTRTFQSIHELLRSSSLKIEVNPSNHRRKFFQKVLVTKLYREIYCWALRL